MYLNLDSLTFYRLFYGSKNVWAVLLVQKIFLWPLSPIITIHDASKLCLTVNIKKFRFILICLDNDTLFKKII